MANRKRLLIDRDALVNAPRKKIADLCVSVFDRLQQARKEHQVLALACAFLLLCDSCNVPAQEAFTAAGNVMAERVGADGLEPQFRAMKYHLDTEVLTGKEYR